MGLDAWVYCDCVDRGRLASPHPFPDLLFIDEDGGPEIRSDDLEMQIAHDRWQAISACCHTDCILVRHYLGNIARVEHLRRNVSDLASDPETDYPVIWSRVIYNGTHCGDRLNREQVEALESEVQRLRSRLAGAKGDTDEARLGYFLTQLVELIEASRLTGKPICF